MLSLLFSNLRRKIKTDTATTLLLIIGLVTSLFCISVLLGYAQTEYKNSRGISYRSTITIDPSNELNKQDLISRINKIEQKYSNEIINVLYISRLADGTVLIGWDGNEIIRWFPQASERFFTHDEISNCQNVVYMPLYEYYYDDEGNIRRNAEPILGTFTTIDSEKYKIIGTGWYQKHNIADSISSQSSQSIFQDHEQIDLKIRIIPYTTYNTKYRPEIVLIQFADESYSELTKYCNEINKEKVGTAFVPDHNSDEMLAEKKMQKSVISAMLVIISGITILQLMYQWIKSSKKQCLVYLICGLTKTKTFLLIAAEWFIYFIVALFLTELLHFSLLIPLSNLGVSYMPNFFDMILAEMVLYLLTILFMFKPICKITNTDRNEEG